MAEDLGKLLEKLRARYPDDELDIVRRAFAFARDAHAGQRRLSGAPYFSHIYATAVILTNWGMTPTMVAAGLLHDVPEETTATIADLKERFGDDVAQIVEGETKLSALYYHGRERFAENLRKMFVAMAKDTRVIIVKCADRVDNLHTLHVFPAEKQRRIAVETLEIYAPIANRLSMYEIKAQLEDLAFPVVYPTEAAWLDALVEPGEERRHTRCATLEQDVTRILAQHRIVTTAVEGRLKHRYSLYLKLLAHDRDIAQIHDLLALRIVVRDVADCYAVLGIIHERWKPLRGRMKDYIAVPKANGYRSIHTTVTLEDGETIEFQIRTVAMHEEAEWGAAAAWRYHERGSYRPPAHQLRWVEDLIAWQRSAQDSQEFLSGLQLEVLKDRILVFTPKGDVIELPDGATPLDFAYAIHSDIGNRAVSARVNGANALHPLDRRIENGAMIEIITDPKRKGPSPDWLGFVKTTRARTKIRDAIRARQRTAAGQWDTRVPATKQPKRARRPDAGPTADRASGSFAPRITRA